MLYNSYLKFIMNLETNSDEDRGQCNKMFIWTLIVSITKQTNKHILLLLGRWITCTIVTIIGSLVNVHSKSIFRDTKL